jgi:hypothetical protein
MPRLAESLSRFVGRVELFARGLDGERRAAEEALSRGRPLDARERARAILVAVPGSPLGLALWADAAEEAWLDHEAYEALSELSTKLPWRADVWLRLGRAALRVGRPEAREALARAAASPDDRDSARAALLALADVDLAAGDPARALRWLDRIAPSVGAPDADVGLRRAEAHLALGQADPATEAAASIGDEPAEPGRAACVRARLALLAAEQASGQGLGVAADHALRAFLLDATGGAEALAAVVAASRDAVLVDRVRRVVAARGELDSPSFAAAFAFAEGRRDDARRALARGLGAGDAGAVSALLRLAAEARDLGALHVLAERDPRLLPPDLARLREAAVLHGSGDDGAALAALDAVRGDASAWAGELRRSIVATWVPADRAARAAWGRVLPMLRELSSGLDRLDLVRAVEALAVEGERPLRLAVVGEFNAGKSTFLNALLGVDVAPTGVLPTTATLHWVAWAPDAFARVVVRGAQDRVVQHAALKSTLRGLVDGGARVDRVFIYAPIERLKRVEVLDTPGFNAPDPDHVAAARQAFDEAHVAIWLLDATSPLKDSERRVLEEIRALGVPVQILVNKADRLAPDGLERVLGHVREGLASTGLTTYAAPIAFSARLSLAGRLGDEAALAASGWGPVEALLSEGIVDRSDALREVALRRKAARIAAELAELGAARSAEARAAARAAAERSATWRAAAARLRRECEAIGVQVTRALEPHRAALAADLGPLTDVFDERGRQDRGVRGYVAERFVARLAEPTVAAIASVLGVPAPERAAAAVASALLGAVSAQEDPAGLATRALEPAVEAAILAFAQALSAVAQEDAPSAPAALLALRAEALHDALRASAAPPSPA